MDPGGYNLHSKLIVEERQMVPRLSLSRNHPLELLPYSVANWSSTAWPWPMEGRFRQGP